MKYKPSISFLVVVFISVFATFQTSESNELLNGKTNAKKQEIILEVKESIELFFKSNTKMRFEMMSSRYREMIEKKDILQAAFGKESYNVARFVKIVPFENKKTRDLMVYVEVEAQWFFEGYKGKQTCHFNLINENRNWRIDWFLC